MHISDDQTSTFHSRIANVHGQISTFMVTYVTFLFPLSDRTFSWLNSNLQIALARKTTVKCALRGKGPRICWQQETPPCTNGESAQFGDEPSFFTPWQIFLAIQGDFDGIACENQCCWDQFSQRVGLLEVRPELPRYHLVLTISINHMCHAQKLDWII